MGHSSDDFTGIQETKPGSWTGAAALAAASCPRKDTWKNMECVSVIFDKKEMVPIHGELHRNMIYK